MSEVVAPIVWKPLPGSQALALACPCDIVLYHGTRGPGKTDAQLMAFRKLVGRGYGRHWRGVIFDRQYKNLDDVVSKANRWFTQFGDGAQFLQSVKDYKWVWPTGEELLFRSLESDSDYWKYHGQEFTFIGWNELCKFPTPKLFDQMMSCNRSSFLPREHSPKDRKTGKVVDPLPEIPLVVFATTNPYGPGHNWVKRRFIDRSQPGEVLKQSLTVFNPQTRQEETVTKTQTHIFGSYRENYYLSPKYIATLTENSDDNTRRAWLQGDWNIVAGGALDDVWRESIHLLPRFPIPKGWITDRTMDWGSSKPFSIGWWAEANGEEVTLPNGRVFCPPAGSLIQFFEWYGSKEIGSNIGLKLSPTEVALGIKERDEILLNGNWILQPTYPGPADNAIRNVVDVSTDTIEKKMEDEGISWEDSDKSPGSRVIGLELLRTMLKAAMKHAKGDTDAGPGLYFMDNCVAAIATLPVLPRDEKKVDDVDTNAEDHAYDQTRYRVLKGASRVPVTLKAAFAR